MRLGYWFGVAMLVMIIVHVPVLMRERFVKMFVLMPLGEMEPKP